MRTNRYRARFRAASRDELADGVEAYGSAVRDVGMEPAQLHLLARGPEDARVHPATLDDATRLLRDTDDVRLEPDIRYGDPERGTTAMLTGTGRRDVYRVGVEGPAGTAEEAQDAVEERMALSMQRQGPLGRVLEDLSDAYCGLLG